MEESSSIFWVGTSPEDVAKVVGELQVDSLSVSDADLIIAHIICSAYAWLAEPMCTGHASLSTAKRIYSELKDYGEFTDSGDEMCVAVGIVCESIFNDLQLPTLPNAPMFKQVDMLISRNSKFKHIFEWLWLVTFGMEKQDTIEDKLNDDATKNSILLDICRALKYGYKTLVERAMEYDPSLYPKRDPNSQQVSWLMSCKMSADEFVRRVHECIQYSTADTTSDSVDIKESIHEIYSKNAEYFKSYLQMSDIEKTVSDTLEKFMSDLPEAVQSKLDARCIMLLYADSATRGGGIRTSEGQRTVNYDGFYNHRYDEVLQSICDVQQMLSNVSNNMGRLSSCMKPIPYNLDEREILILFFIYSSVKRKEWKK